MGNLEKQLNELDAVIRNYLFDRLDEETALEIDEKIFLEPDFYDCVLLVVRHHTLFRGQGSRGPSPARPHHRRGLAAGCLG